MKKIIFTLITLIVLLFVSNNAFAQKYKSFQSLIFEKNGNTYLKITPSVVDGYASSDTEHSGLYGILVCYTSKGKQKAKKLDMTFEIVTNKVYELYLGFGKSSNFQVNNIEYFYLPKDKGPSKESCFN